MPVTLNKAPPTEAILVVNTQSRRGIGAFERACRALARLGIRLLGTYPVDRPTEVPKVAAAAANAGIPLVVVGGGDGTIAAAARHLVNRETALGVIPLGTGNDFARNLGLPFDVESACEVVAQGKVALVDVGQFDGHCFVNVAAIGFSGRVARRVSVLGKRLLGRGQFLIAAVLELLAVQPFQARVTGDDRRYDLTTTLVVIGNGRYHAGGRLIGRDASVDDHRLTVYATPDGSRRSLLRLAWRLAWELPIGDGEFPYFTTTAVRVETEPLVEVDADGEVVQTTPVTARVLPNALHVVVPPTFVDR